MTAQITEVRPLDSLQIDEPDLNPRGPVSHDQILLLAENIGQNGLLNPLTITPSGRVIAGVRRFLALRHLQVAEVRCTVVEPPDEVGLLRIRLAENKDTDPMPPLRLALWIAALPEKTGLANSQVEHQFTLPQGDVSRCAKISRIAGNDPDFAAAAGQLNGLRPIAELAGCSEPVRQHFYARIQKGSVPTRKEIVDYKQAVQLQKDKPGMPNTSNWGELMSAESFALQDLVRKGPAIFKAAESDPRLALLYHERASEFHARELQRLKSAAA